MLSERMRVALRLTGDGWGNVPGPMRKSLDALRRRGLVRMRIIWRECQEFGPESRAERIWQLDPTFEYQRTPAGRKALKEPQQ